MNAPRWGVEHIAPRQRVISDNDYAGDPDGLVQLAHLLLSPSVDVRCVIGSHLGAADPFDLSGRSSASAAAAARTIAEMTGRGDGVPVVAGSEVALADRATPIDSPSARAIITEALRDDTTLPLFVTCGGGLTEIASAWLLEPRIAQRLTLIWIGGGEHEGLAERPPGAQEMEYNTGIDPIAAQVVFNDSDLVIWQVPRTTYRMAIASRAELLTMLRPVGELGRHLFDELGAVAEMVGGLGVDVGETYVLGDSPLVLLTALWTGFEPSPASSPSVTLPCPTITDSGGYAARADGRPLRVFTGIDTRLMLADFYAKLALLASSLS